MKIAFLGRVTLTRLSEHFQFYTQLPSVRWDFNYGSDLVAALVRAGHDVSVVVADINHVAPTIYKAERLEIRIVPERRCRYQYLAFYSKEIEYLIDEICKINPDVILANWTYQYARAALKSGFPALVVAHDSPWRVFWTMRNFTSLFKALYSQLLIFPHVKYLSTVSPHMAVDLRRFNFWRKSIEIIPNAIQEGTELSDCVKIRPEAQTILCVTQWGRLKNSKVLLKAFATLQERHPKWRLIVYGHYMDYRGADPWMRQIGLGYLLDSGSVELRGYGTSKNIRQSLWNEADIFCSPSLEESFGMVFIEAMAMGVPCVGGEKSGAVPWVIGDGGVVCDVTKYEKLAECIESLMLDYTTRKTMSDKAVMNVKKRFMMDAVVKRYIAVLENVVNEEHGK